MITAITHFLTTPPGTEMPYHTGLLMRDRCHDPALDNLATYIWDLYETGAVSLRQRRHPRGTEYLIVNLPHAGAVWAGCYKTAAYGLG